MPSIPDLGTMPLEPQPHPDCAATGCVAIGTRCLDCPEALACGAVPPLHPDVPDGSVEDDGCDHPEPEPEPAPSPVVRMAAALRDALATIEERDEALHQALVDLERDHLALTLAREEIASLCRSITDAEDALDALGAPAAAFLETRIKLLGARFGLDCVLRPTCGSRRCEDCPQGGAR